MNGTIVVELGGVWIGATVALSRLRWFSRQPLAERLRAYSPTAPGQPRSGAWSLTSVREVVGPGVEAAATALAGVFGVSETAAVRLRRIHSPRSSIEFRLRQGVSALVAVTVGASGALLLQAPPAVAVMFVIGSPLLAFLVLEQQLAAASAGWQRRIFLELPTVTEQLATLLSAGWSLGAALHRLASRGTGACATDLGLVVRRIQHGLGEIEALGEWADRAGVDELTSVIRTLSHTRETSELGRLLAEEARAIRREVHRETIRTIEQRAQQVWIPVTVATLLPGVILLSIPFSAAMRVYAG